MLFTILFTLLCVVTIGVVFLLDNLNERVKFLSARLSAKESRAKDYDLKREMDFVEQISELRSIIGQNYAAYQNALRVVTDDQNAVTQNSIAMSIELKKVTDILSKHVQSTLDKKTKTGKMAKKKNN